MLLLGFLNVIRFEGVISNSWKSFCNISMEKTPGNPYSQPSSSSPSFVTTFRILPLRAKSHATRRRIPGHRRMVADIHARARATDLWEFLHCPFDNQPRRGQGRSKPYFTPLVVLVLLWSWLNRPVPTENKSFARHVTDCLPNRKCTLFLFLGTLPSLASSIPRSGL